MKRMGSVVTGLIALAALTAGLSAASGPAGAVVGDAARQLTVEECVQLALANNPALRISHAAIQQTDAKVREVVAGALPDFKLTAGYTRLSPVDPFIITLPTHPALSETISPSILNNYTGRLSVQQPLFTGFRMISGIRMAGEMARAARQDSARDRSGLVFEVQSTYWNLFKAREARKLVDRNLEQVGAHLRDLQTMAAIGRATRNDVLKVEVQQSNVELMRLDADNAIQVAMTALDNLTGLPLGTELEPVSVPDSGSIGEGGGQGLENLIAAAINRRPEVKGLEMRSRAARDAIAVARGAWFPQIALTGNYYYSRPNQRIQPPKDEFKNTWDVGVGANFEVWNWGVAGHQTAQAKAQYAQTQASLVQLKNGVALEVTQDFLAQQRAEERVRVAAKALDQATEGLSTAQAGFKAGVLLSSELLDAEVAFLQAQLNRTQALADLAVARARLTKTLGEEQ